MPKQPTKGTKQLNVELPLALVDAFKAFCEARGESPTHNVGVAIRRHMANPPPLPHDVPLPDAPAEPEAVVPQGKGIRKGKVRA